MWILKRYKPEELIKKEKEIFTSSVWYDNLTGVDCENLLRGKENFSYLIRCGEAQFHYYLSYVLESPFIYRHQPFTITQKDSKLGWGYQNGHTWWAVKLEDFVPLIIHQPVERCISILKN